MVFSAEKRTKIAERWQSFRERPAVKRAFAFIHYSLLVAIVGYLIFRLTQVGWVAVFDALPLNAWFYVFFCARFLVLPVSELIIYEMIWGVSLKRHFPVFVRKRVYNFAVMGYSGEAFLTLWARRNLPISTKDVVVGVKDNNLMSALMSNLTTVFMIIALAVSGGLMAGIEAMPSGAAILFAVAFGTALTLSVAVILLRSKLIALPVGKFSTLMAVHAIRTTLILGLHFGMYMAALPETPIMAWMIFIALQLVLSRIPFIPNQDLVFLGVALSLSALTNATEAAVAGMLLAEAGLSQIVNFTLFFATAYLAKVEPATAEAS